MDTTLRDGEQTSGVSFAAHEKLSIAQALLDLGVNRLEIASARVSDGEFEAVKRVASWAERTGNIQKLEVLGFVDGDVSLNWIEAAGCRVVNLLCKGSYKHVTEQLRKTPEHNAHGISFCSNIDIAFTTYVNGTVSSFPFTFVFSIPLPHLTMFSTSNESVLLSYSALLNPEKSSCFVFPFVEFA